MIPALISKLYLENHIALVEAAAGGESPSWQYALFSDDLEDPSRDIVFDSIAMHELDYPAYARQDIDADDIIGPEHWAEGWYLRYPQSNFPIAGTGQPARWIGIVCVGTLETILVQLEKLGFLWDASTSGAPLRHTFKSRARHAVP